MDTSRQRDVPVFEGQCESHIIGVDGGDFAAVLGICILKVPNFLVWFIFCSSKCDRHCVWLGITSLVLHFLWITIKVLVVGGVQADTIRKHLYRCRAITEQGTQLCREVQV